MTQRQAAMLLLGSLAIVILMSALMIGKAFSNNLMALPVYIGAAIAAAIAIKRWAPKAQKSLCSNCGRGIDVKDKVVFPGGFEIEEEGKPLPAIMERRYLCQQCNQRHLEIVTTKEAPEEYWIYREDKTRPVISKSQWESILDEAKKAAEIKNQQPRQSGDKWMF